MLEKKSVWAMLPGIVDQPGATLANAAAYPRWRWLLPAALALIALILSAVLTAPLLATQAQQALVLQLNRLPADQLERVQAQMAVFQSPAMIGAMAVATGVFGLALGWLLQAAIVYFGLLIGGAEVDFRRLLAAAPWLGIPFVLETLEQTAYVLSRGQLIVNQGLSYLVSSGKPLEDVRNLTYVALSQVSLFRLWHLWLVYVLLRVAGKLDRGAAFFLTVVYAAVTVGGQLVLAALGGQAISGL
jgi:hypothetical protein